jgi:hypothetical protein
MSKLNDNDIKNCNINILCNSFHHRQLNPRLLLILAVAPLLHDRYFHHELVVDEHLRMKRVQDVLETVVDIEALEDVSGSAWLEQAVRLEMALRAFEMKTRSNFNWFVVDRGSGGLLFRDDLLRLLLVFHDALVATCRSLDARG